mgnify:CR=1 FL=1
MPLGNDVSMKILVTGAGGLLGGRIVDFLQSLGYNVLALSRSYGGHESWKDKVQIIHADLDRIEDVSRYVVPYTGKRHNTSQAEIDAFQNIIMK